MTRVPVAFQVMSARNDNVPHEIAMSALSSWKRQSASLRLLRAFLGVTFVYAGIQKLADPNFFRPGSPTYVGSQIRGFATGSPIASLLHLVSHFPIVTGIAIAVIETAIGVGVLLGIGDFGVAVGGCVINTVLWLSATWHVHPFFLGSDSIYAVAWAAYALSIWEAKPRPSPAARSRAPAAVVDRRSFVRGGVVAAGTLAFALLARALSRFGPISSPGSGVSAAGEGSGAGSAVHHAATSSSTGTPSPSAIKGQVIASLNKLRVGQPIGFLTRDGTPGALFRLSQNKVVAFSRICTHAGCTVGYDPSAKLLFCPCHGAEFDPARGAAVVAGPAPVPLPSIRVVIDPVTHKVVLPG